MTRTRWWSVGFFAAAGAFILSLGAARSDAHKLISSKYTYNDDIFPILRDRCGRCHVADGVAPMSLMTYKDAYPWGESLRAELITGHMPPWNLLDDVGSFKHAPPVTASDIDKVLTWASGGNPEGNPLNVPPDVTFQHGWPLGKPDLVLEPPSAYTMAADRSDIVAEFTLATGTSSPKWVRAVDVLPGTPAIVRSASVSVKAAGADPLADPDMVPARVLAVWLPGDSPVAAEGGAAFHLPAGAEIIVRIHYKKTYRYEGKELTDRSQVGLYFAPGPAEDIRRLTVASPPLAAASGTRLTFSRTLKEDVTALAFSPDPALSNVRLELTSVSTDGVRTPLAHLAVRPDWTRRYWFEPPLKLSRGSSIEVTAVLNGADTLLPPAASPTPPQAAIDAVRVLFDVVPSPSHPTVQ